MFDNKLDDSFNKACENIYDYWHKEKYNNFQVVNNYVVVET